MHPPLVWAMWLTLTLAEGRSTGELARGELMRYFAEAARYPTALLPSQGVHWAAVDDHSANATRTDGAIGVTMPRSFQRRCVGCRTDRPTPQAQSRSSSNGSEHTP